MELEFIALPRPFPETCRRPQAMYRGRLVHGMFLRVAII
jgi:hypothetical protein